MELHGAQAPVPKSVRDLLLKTDNTHPGLQLDKYAETWSASTIGDSFAGQVQRHVVDAVVRLSQAPPDGLDFKSLLARRQRLWTSLSATVIEAETVGPFTLHLARASALENAGICLHPIYGCLHLPGTGIKGMTRAFAETVWKPEQSDEQQANQIIQRVFGYVGERTDEDQVSGGSVVFHDGWPTAWPKLEADILNSHHSRYYGESDNRVPPPGDWEEPIPVVFLTATVGSRFQFAISLRRRPQKDELDNANRLLELASEWLTGALEHLGAGAKTTAGYGTFRVLQSPAGAPKQAAAKTETPPSVRRLARAQYELELITPAFLAGPHQPNDGNLYSAAECDLRPASLRGMLRWWWRTMYAGWIRPVDLRRLEDAVWGSTEQAGAVRVIVESIPGVGGPVLFDRDEIIRTNHLPGPPNRKTTQGLTYHTYGMDEDRGRRHFRPPGAKWRITITGRSTKLSGSKADIAAPEMLRQAQAALWFLCEYGGVGAKSRKGFGAFAVPAELPAIDVAEFAASAPQFLSSVGIVAGNIASPDISPAWKHAIVVEAIDTPWKNYLMALDRVGSAAQSFAQSKKHLAEKKALGLPRNVGKPVTGTFHAGADVSRTNRHSSPLQFHLQRATNGTYAVRIVAFPSPQLPNFEVSRQFLQNAAAAIRANVLAEVETHASVGARLAVLPAPPPTAPAVQTISLPKPGERVSAKLSAERTGKGGWRALHEASKLIGPIQNSGDVPGDKLAGQILDLIVAIISAKEIAFRYPTAADEARAAKPSKPPAKGPKRW
ncbi:MAG: type III-B CRISPR module RAMP protein Cmr6 [Planctomycetota bacterium]